MVSKSGSQPFSGTRLRNMRMQGIVMVWALRRLGVKPKCRIIELLVPNLAGIKTRYRIVAHHAKEVSPRFLARTSLVFEPQRFEQGSLLRRCQLYKSFSPGLLSMGVQPCEPHAKSVLHLRIVRDHEINELRDAGLVGARRAVARDDDVGQPLDHGVLRSREKLRMIHRWLDLQRRVADMAAGECPLAEARKLRRGRRCPQYAQHFPPSNPLSGH